MSRLTIGLTLLAAVVLQPGPARATFPGENGKFAVQIESGPYSDQIVILNPDGSFGDYFPFFEDAHHADPNWSPDGHLIAFGYDHRIAVAKPDGSDLVKLTDGSDEAPKWSPDQTSILFERFDFSHNIRRTMLRRNGLLTGPGSVSCATAISRALNGRFT